MDELVKLRTLRLRKVKFFAQSSHPVASSSGFHTGARSPENISNNNEGFS